MDRFRQAIMFQTLRSFFSITLFFFLVASVAFLSWNLIQVLLLKFAVV